MYSRLISLCFFGLLWQKKGEGEWGLWLFWKINYFFLFVDVVEWLWWRFVKREGRRERQSERDVYVYICLRVREIYTYLHICVYICIYLRTHIYAHMYTHLCKDTNKWNYMCTCTIYTHKCVCACLYVHMFVCIYVSLNCIDVVCNFIWNSTEALLEAHFARGIRIFFFVYSNYRLELWSYIYWSYIHTENKKK